MDPCNNNYYLMFSLSGTALVELIWEFMFIMFSSYLLAGLVGASPLATTTEGSNMPQLALWGQICCRLAARPECVEAAQMSGFLEIQVRVL